MTQTICDVSEIAAHRLIFLIYFDQADIYTTTCIGSGYMYNLFVLLLVSDPHSTAQHKLCANCVAVINRDGNSHQCSHAGAPCLVNLAFSPSKTMSAKGFS